MYGKVACPNGCGLWLVPEYENHICQLSSNHYNSSIGRQRAGDSSEQHQHLSEESAGLRGPESR